MQARIAATGLIAGAVQGDDTQDSQPPHVDLMPCTFHSPSPRRASDWGMMEFCKRYGHSQDHGMARQTSGQQIPPKGTTRQKISKTSPSKREIHGFLTDRITRFPCQNMKLCKLGTGRRVSRRQGTKHPQKGRPDRSCPPTFACESLPGAKTRAAGSLSHAKVSQGARPAPDCPPTFACESLPGAKTRAADSLSHAKVSRGQDLPRTARPLSHAKGPRGPRPELPTHFRMRKSPPGVQPPRFLRSALIRSVM